MPIYEYQCTACQHKLEALQKFSDAPMVTCPHCGKDTLTKLVSAAAFQLKGSGWYQTDFRGGGGKPPAKPDAASGDGKAADASDVKSGAAAAKSETTAAKSETGAAKSETTAAKSDTPAAPAGGPSTAA